MYKILPVILFFAALVGCQSEAEQQRAQKIDYSKYREPLIEINRELIARDSEQVAAYVERRGWDMQISGTGLWYNIYDRAATGDSVQNGKWVRLAYQVSLLDGTVCYTGDSAHAKVFKSGQGGVEAGLEEAVLLMKTGDKARIIMPPHLAHGIPGDGDKIPRRAIIQYDITLLDVLDNRPQ